MPKFCSPDVGPLTCPWRMALYLVPRVFSFSPMTLFENREAPKRARRLSILTLDYQCNRRQLLTMLSSMLSANIFQIWSTLTKQEEQTFLACIFRFPNSDHETFSRGFAFRLFIRCTHICTWMHVHGTTFEKYQFPGVPSRAVKWENETERLVGRWINRGRKILGMNNKLFFSNEYTQAME